MYTHFRLLYTDVCCCDSLTHHYKRTHSSFCHTPLSICSLCFSAFSWLASAIFSRGCKVLHYKPMDTGVNPCSPLPQQVCLCACVCVLCLVLSKLHPDASCTTGAWLNWEKALLCHPHVCFFKNLQSYVCRLSVFNYFSCVFMHEGSYYP